MKVKRKKGFFSISAVAKMFSVHQQTIRLYEKQGLIDPKRSAGNTRLFTEEDINRLEEVIYLTHELGINLAGVEMILKLKKQVKKLQKEINKFFADAQKEFDKEVEVSKASIQTTSQRLIQLKKQTNDSDQPFSSTTSPKPQKTTGTKLTPTSEFWKIEYDEQ